MAFKGPRHLHVESYLWIRQSVRIGLATVCQRLGGARGGLEKPLKASSLTWDAVNEWPGSEGPHTASRTCTFTHVCAGNKHRRARTGRPLQPCLPCNLRRQHGPSPFQIEHMVQAQKTKQTCWPPRRTVHRVRLVFSSPLTRSIYTDSRSTPHLWLELHTYLHPCNNSDMYCKRDFFLFPLSPVFCFSALCFKHGSTSKQWNGQIDSGRQMLFHKRLRFRLNHSDAFLK